MKLKLFYKVRRKVLHYVIPKFVWPKEIFIDNFSLKLRNAPYSFGTKYSLLKGNYEIHERILLQNQINQDDIIFEMGGSIGVLTAILGNYTLNNGFVVSVEASKKLVDYSVNWLQEYKNISILNGYAFPVKILSKNIEIDSFDESGGSLGGILKFNVSNKDVNKKNHDTIYDINSLSRLYNVSPSVLVIDIEGSEKILLENNPEFPLSIRLILIELHSWIYGNEVKQKIIAIIMNEGFALIGEKKEVFLFKRV